MFYELYSKYLTSIGEINSAGFHSVRCPFHDDSHPSAAFNSHNGVFICHVCGSFSVLKFVEEIEHVTEAEASVLLDRFYKSYTDSFGPDSLNGGESFSIKKVVFRTDWDALYLKSQNLMNPTLPIVAHYMESRRISYDTLVKAHIGFLRAEDTEWGRDSLIFPYLYKGKVTALRYRDIRGNKLSKPGSRFIPFGLDYLTDDRVDVLYVVEGESDYLAMLEHSNLPVVSTPGSMFKHEWSRFFGEYSKIFCIPQDDNASLKMASSLRSVLPESTILKLPWRSRDEGKDLNDWFKQHTDEEFKSFLEISMPLKKRILTTAEVLAMEDEGIEWYISDCVSPGQIGIIAGSPKSMKTWFAMNLISCLITPYSTFLGNDLWINPCPQPLKVLFVQEEGNDADIRNRIRSTIGDNPNHTELFWSIRNGVRLDSGANLDVIEEVIDYNRIDVLILDPMQRLHACDENSSSEMAQVWANIIRLQLKFPRLAIIIIHHFTKSSNIEHRWNALRGSSRLAGEVDFGFFLEQLPIEDRPFPGIRFYADGRLMSSETIERLWTAEFTNGQMRVRNGD